MMAEKISVPGITLINDTPKRAVCHCGEVENVTADNLAHRYSKDYISEVSNIRFNTKF